MKTGLAALLFLFPLTLAAQDHDVSLFLGGAVFETTTIAAFLPGDVEADLGFENGRSFALGFNHFWREGFSTELAIFGLETDPTLELRTGPINARIDVGDIRAGGLTATAQWHFRRYARVSPYAGAGLALLSGEFEAEFADEIGEFTRTTAELEGAAALLFNGGVNIRMSDRWFFGIDLKVIPYSPELEAVPIDEIPEEIVITDELDLNPVIVGFGVRYRF